MKIIYVLIHASYKETSFQNKVISQIRALNQEGHECKGLFFTVDELKPQHNDLFEMVHVEKIKGNWFKSIRMRNQFHKSVFNELTQQNRNFDKVYFRYSGASFKFLKLMKRIGENCLIEHVTSEIPEYKIYSKENPLRFNISSILGRFEYVTIHVLMEKYIGKRIRNRAMGGICNSNTIRDYQNKLANRNYIKLISGDAVDTDSFQTRIKLPELTDEFTFIFLKGASMAADFNGLDRVFEGIKNYKGAYQLKFYLAGNHLNVEKDKANKLGIENKVEFLGFINRDTMNELNSSVHIGFSALAVHRKGLESTTTIKSREYTARGIPFVYGHHDPDFSDNELSRRFSMQIESNDTAVDFNHVIEFYKRCLTTEKITEEMRQFAVKNLDYKVKMRKVLEVLS